MLIKLKNFFLFLSIITAISTSCAQQEYENKKFNFQEVDSIISDGITDHAFPGAVVLISKDDKIIYEKAFGHLTYGDTAAIVSTNTIYDIASLTKVIATTTAAMICYDRKLFTLDDPISKYVPAFTKNGKENVTIKNLLLHNSGLPASKQFYKKHLTRDEILSDIYSLPLYYETGTKTVYSDLGMIVLDKVIEKVTRKKFDEFCKENIFIPLQMNSTMFNPPDSIKYKIAPTEKDNYWRHRLIWGEVHDENSSLLGGVAGHAGLFSTTEDIAKLLNMLLSNGKYGDLQMIDSSTVYLFTKRYSENSTRALGWDTKSEENSSAGNLFDITSFGHTGFTGTSAWIDPTRKLFVILLTNRVYPTRENNKIYKIRPALHDAIIKAID
jgi:CubicO group peptidase (beta-lactamase class C family)